MSEGECQRMREELYEDYKWKERKPEDTVRVIQKILKNKGIQTREEWLEPAYENCYSMRLYIEGTEVGQNGKGITKIFAQASGYAEFLERFLLEKMYEGRREEQLQLKLEEQLRFIRLTEDLESYGKGRKDGMESDDSFVISRREGKALYATNGCCAGNDFYEALVQGISEIVERHHSIYFYKENLTPPKIPYSFWKRFPVVKSVMDRIRKEDKYQIDLLDCSMGQAYPVVCAVIWNKKTMEYGVRFGAHPIWEIAIERSMTEIFQGRGASQAAMSTDRISDSEKQYDMLHVFRLVKSGNGEVREKFLTGDPDFIFRETSGYKKTKEIGFLEKTKSKNFVLAEFAEHYIKKMGYAIYIRDVSVSEFAVFQILIPGFSEIFGDFKEERIQDFRKRDLCIDVITNLKEGKSVAEEKIWNCIDYLWDKLLMQQENTLSFTMNLPLHEIAARPVENVKLICCFFIFLHKYYTAWELLCMLLQQEEMSIDNRKRIEEIEKLLRSVVTEGVEEAYKKDTVERIHLLSLEILGFYCPHFQCAICKHRSVCDYRKIKFFL